MRAQVASSAQVQAPRRASAPSPTSLHAALGAVSRPLKLDVLGRIPGTGPFSAELVSSVSAQLRPQLQDMRSQMRACYEQDMATDSRYSGLAPSQLPVRGPFAQMAVGSVDFNGDGALQVSASFLALAYADRWRRPIGFATFAMRCTVEESTKQLVVDVSLECAWLQPRKRGQGGGRVLAESVSYALDAYLEGLRKVWVRAGAPPQGVKLQVDIAGSVYSESGEEFVYAAHDAVAARFQFPGVVGFKLNSLRASAEW